MLRKQLSKETTFTWSTFFFWMHTADLCIMVGGLMCTSYIYDIQQLLCYSILLLHNVLRWSKRSLSMWLQSFAKFSRGSERVKSVNTSPCCGA